MAKLYFRYGTVGSAKTLNLLAVAHNYRQQGKKVILIKPAIDVRFGKADIKSRSGLSERADIVLEPGELLDLTIFDNVSCVLVDEAQFVDVAVVDQLRDITYKKNVPVICYGLRSDFRSKFFPASCRLMEIADAIEELKTTCAFCNRKAIMNLKHANGVPTVDGPSVDLGAEEKYFPACFSCYKEQLAQSLVDASPQMTQKVVGL